MEQQPAGSAASGQDDAAQTAERLQLALSAGAIIGTWVWDIPNDRVTGDERFARAFAADTQQSASRMALDRVALAIHPEDPPRVRAMIENTIAPGGRSSGTPSCRDSC